MSQTTSPPIAVTGKLVDKGLEFIELALPGSEYRLKLVTDGEVSAAVGEKVTGTIHARARRVDKVRAGGRFVEPVFGRPRRVQGRIIGGDVEANAIHVKAGPPVLLCSLTDERQKAGGFEIGQLVSFDVEPGARFVMRGG